MNSSFNQFHQTRTLERTVQPDKFDQVIEAIASGKYSWACVLMLRFAGYNPLHYIPYSTYNRIVKDGEPKPIKAIGDRSLAETTQVPDFEVPDFEVPDFGVPDFGIQDLGHLEAVPEESASVTGGFAWLARWPW